ncbi:MBL fold metallo-hydrolase [Homoserinibacter sp. YIM 151385]|uniref:MBL fold metallo-hydrolase n=1 Tax=Homoserinibacter sp. YIM 151385 TaxID=2985506 RepID=UPI0022F11914|nr:MBL fold metallo-hydrolase [Homoserinibacter sp. YIM 151385]WBU37511.1 MBL fold metallo-hydrolase [Homoserinibacter sp. YIM 151385]
MSALIEPELQGAALAAEIRDARPEPGTAALWRLGQSGIVVRFPAAAVAIDLYLGNHGEAVLGEPFDHRRMTRSPVDPVDLDALDVVICSHEHLDHLDPPTMRTLARENPRAVVVAPRACQALLEELGWAGRIVLADDGWVAEVAGLRVEAFAVPHDEFDAGEDGHPYLGFIVGDGRLRVGHLGDARAHRRVTAALAADPVDLLAAPINGRDDARKAMGFAGNMSAAEAVETADDAGARLTLPMHYDMFQQNVDAGALDAFVAAAESRALPFRVLPVGRRLELRSS